MPALGKSCVRLSIAGESLILMGVKDEFNRLAQAADRQFSGAAYQNFDQTDLPPQPRQRTIAVYEDDIRASVHSDTLLSQVGRPPR